MKQNFETAKLYYGFPVFLVGYKDEKFGYNITTSSSSYTLGDMLVMGLTSTSNAAKQIKKFRQFTVNLLTAELGLFSDQAGWVSHRDKLSMTGLDYQFSSKVDAPLITISPLSIECQVEDISEFENFTNFTARILERKIEEDLLLDGRLQNRKLSPLLYTGDGYERTYRYMTDEIHPSGHYLKAFKRLKKENTHD